jgi:hypothetical protein
MQPTQLHSKLFASHRSFALPEPHLDQENLFAFYVFIITK